MSRVDISVKVLILWVVTYWELNERSAWFTEALTLAGLGICISVVLHDLVVDVQDTGWLNWFIGIAIEMCLIGVAMELDCITRCNQSKDDQTNCLLHIFNIYLYLLIN